MIKLENITKSFLVNGETISILKNISLDIKEGEFISILGQSGSGKSTLLNLLGFLDKKFEGKYFFQERRIESFSDNELSKIRNENVGFIFQNFGLIENMTVQQNIELPLIYSGKTTKRAHEIAQNCLKKVGLEFLSKQSVRLLSGGQRQRVAIARAIANQPSFIIADEPTGSLDSKTSNEIMKLFKELNKTGVTIILVTHDETLISYCDRVIRILDGEVLH